MMIRLAFVLTFICLIFGGSLALAEDIDIAKLKAKAEKGDAKVQYFLAYLYYEGEGVTKDYNEAVKWMRKAADQGDAKAQLRLGLSYYYGEGVTKDYNEAVKWWRKAAVQGGVEAQFRLSCSHLNGEGAIKDIIQGLAWLKLASAGGGKDIKKYLKDLELKMTRDQIAQATQLAYELEAKIKKK